MKFNRGEYLAVLTSKVLNEGVNVPEANVAVVLSGSATIREHVQRLGRILRPREGKEAVLYEVVTKGTMEKEVSRRRRGCASIFSIPVQAGIPDLAQCLPRFLAPKLLKLASPGRNPANPTLMSGQL